ncbi:MAG: endonuclease/exonuclease/phosphatase family protein [Pseudomonadota bacterium]
MRLLTLFATFFGLLALAACVQILRNSGSAPLDPAPDKALRVATYNVHYINTFREAGPWSVDDWERRKEPLDQAFKALNADVIGFQEMESFGRRSENNPNLTLDWLLSRNPKYGAAAVGDPAVFPSTQPILYRKDRLTVQDQGWFFFSETPDVIYSRTFNGSYPAFAAWARFADQQTGAVFRVMNIHTDFSSRTNRLQSMELVAARIAPWIDAGETVLVIGDFNARLGAQTLQIVEETGVTFTPVRGATYHLNRGINLFGAIDHIGYVGAALPLADPMVLREKFDGEWPTDHYPVIVDFALDD